MVRSEIIRRKLPPSSYAPSSRYGGTEWTTEDYTELADEWITYVRGNRAKQLVGDNRADKHVADSARKSLYHFTLDNGRPNPKTDLWNALKETFPDYKSLEAGDPLIDPQKPDSLFPRQKETTRRKRQRVISAPEVRDALDVIRALHPSGWTVKKLFEYICEWSGPVVNSGQSVDANDCRKDGSADSRTIGRELAQVLLAELDEQEKAVLCDYVIPHGKGEVSLEQAAQKMGMAQSTLYDQAKKLKTKLNSSQHGEISDLDVPTQREFLIELSITGSENPTPADVLKKSRE